MTIVSFCHVPSALPYAEESRIARTGNIACLGPLYATRTGGLKLAQSRQSPTRAAGLTPVLFPSEKLLWDCDCLCHWCRELTLANETPLRCADRLKTPARYSQSTLMLTAILVSGYPSGITYSAKWL
jgi:hypothetical protein